LCVDFYKKSVKYAIEFDKIYTIIWMDSLSELVTLIYSLTGLFGLIAYWPTYSDLRKNVPSANLNTYLIWVITTGVTFLYGLIVIGNSSFLVVSGLNFLICIYISIKTPKTKNKSRK